MTTLVTSYGPSLRQPSMEPADDARQQPALSHRVSVADLRGNDEENDVVFVRFKASTPPFDASSCVGPRKLSVVGGLAQLGDWHLGKSISLRVVGNEGKLIDCFFQCLSLASPFFRLQLTFTALSLATRHAYTTRRAYTTGDNLLWESAPVAIPRDRYRWFFRLQFFPSMSTLSLKQDPNLFLLSFSSSSSLSAQLPLQLPLRRQRPPRVGDGAPSGLGRGAEDLHRNAGGREEVRRVFFFSKKKKRIKLTLNSLPPPPRLIPTPQPTARTPSPSRRAPAPTTAGSRPTAAARCRSESEGRPARPARS